MFEAFKIGVTVHLTNQVTAGLRTLTSQFRGANSEVTRLQRQMETLQLLMRTGLVSGTHGSPQVAALNTQLATATANAAALHARMTHVTRLLTGGGVMVGAAFGMAHVLRKFGSEGEEYLNRVTQMEMAGFKEQELNRAIQASWKTTREVITTTAADNIHAIVDLTNVMGSSSLAIMALPHLQKAQAVMNASGMGNSRDQAFAAAKVTDMLGKGLNEADFVRNLDAMTRVAEVTQNRITPENFRMTLKTARQAKYGMSEDFLYNVLPTILLDLVSQGGGSGGQGGGGPMLAGFNKIFGQGILNKGALARLQSLGAFSGPLIKTKDLTSMRAHGGIGPKDLVHNPYALIQDWFIPLLEKKHGKNLSTDKLTELVNFYFAGAPGPALDLIQRLATQKERFERERRLFAGAPSTDDAYQLALDRNPLIAHQALEAQWKNLQTALTVNVLPHLYPMLIKVAEGFNYLALALREHPTIAKSIGFAWVGLIAALGTAGPILILAAAWNLLTGTALFPALGTALTAVAGVLGLPAWATLAIIATGLTAIAAAIQVFNMDPAAKKAMADAMGGGSPEENADYSWFGGGKNVPLPPPGRGSYAQAQSPVYLDGHKVGTIISRHQGRAMDRPADSWSAFDPLQGYASTGQTTEH